MAMPDYRITETNIGPLISHSRASVYDVMLAHDAGHDLYRICVNHNLTPVQVQIALEYIEQHRETLKPELKQILKEKAEFERYHRAIAAERKKIPVPMTPERVAFYALLEKNRRLGGETL